MAETPANGPEGVVAGLRRVVDEQRAAGAYADDLSGVELEATPPKRQVGLAERFDLDAEGPRIRFRPELGFSSKPVIGPVITLVKKFLLRLLSFVLHDLARQADAAVTRLEGGLSAETAARENAEADVTDLAKRHEELEARVSKLEESSRSRPSG